MNPSFERKLRQLNKAHYTDLELKAALPNRSLNSQKAIIKRAVSEGLLTHLRKGLYCASELLTSKKPNRFELAEFIYGPSFISLESALSHYQLIPEAVYTTTSATICRSKTFHTTLGDFDFKKTPEKNFLIGVQRIVQNDAVFFLATPWRALSDYVYCYKKNWKSTTALEEDLRLTIDDLPKPTKKLMVQLSAYYHNKRITQFLDHMLTEHRHDR